MKTGSFLKNFPYKEIRDQQKEVLEKLEKSWSKYKYVICEIPTGVGKSGISNAIGMTVNDAFLLTITKQLQDQYVRDFKPPKVVSLKGKMNYTCNIKPELNVECGPCIVDKDLLKDCKKRKICSYYNQREKAVKSQIAVLSMPFFLFSTTCGGYWKPRDVIIVDECHLLEQQLVQWATVKISPIELLNNYDLSVPTYTQASGYKANKKWLQDVWDLILEKRAECFEEVKDLLDGRDPDDLDEDELEELLSSHGTYYKIDKLYKKFEIFFASKYKDQWLCEPEDDGVILTPIEVSDLFQRYMKKMAINKIIFMSATILDMVGFAKTLGLKKEETAILRVDSDFPPEKSPIIYKPSGSMSYTQIDNTIPKIIEDVKKILSKHPNEKGIIHTSNYKIAKAICDGINDTRLIMKEENENNEKLIARHINNTEPTVLVSPSLTTGTDLKDELSRFQIIVKLPYGSLADQRIRKKFDLDPDWYAVEMLRTFVQATGRSTRSAEDWSTTYVLDSAFFSVIMKYRKWFSKNFLKRIIWK